MSETLRFTIESGKICVSDPCYNKGTWCAAWDLEAQTGVWNCEVIKSYEGLWGERVKEINAIAGEIYPEGCIPIDLPWKKLEFDIGVDSGQCGIFDYEKYPDGENTGEYEDENSFYGKCCNLTLPEDDSKEPFGVLENGIVSSSGFGDGSYIMYGLYEENREKLIGVKVIFIDEEEVEDDCCDECHCDDCCECEIEEDES